MKLTSSAFSDHGEIPDRYTHDGEDVSPPLAWSGIPRQARSLALIVDDIDTRKTWVHWVLVDLPVDSAGLPEGIARLPGGRIGVNDWSHAKWNGPSPPEGRHRYAFKLYALDCELGLARPTKHEVEAAMAGHILDEAKLVGTYASRRAA
ncbi:MAG: YbhB/YbcL family Raf kinase inhibitor-like protein [Deltaproteobacteria bacterium]|nr:YbhB/YbcL family Raf kinase inhibitor-like protein [Deltaproteobacteria bacterium]MCW5803614.1 YbhB/YbcL family Raf kinase inhibitor-like protein [Deltaproteobacteria bacterium]